MARITDLAVKADAETIYDLVIDSDTRDLVTTDSLDSALFVSLFTDRRARPDEVAEAIKRRGWDGDLIADIPDDRIGSGLWLYEQRRLTPDVVNGVRAEAELALTWLVPDLAQHVTATITQDAAARSVTLAVAIAIPTGRLLKSYILANATRTGLLART